MYSRFVNQATKTVKNSRRTVPNTDATRFTILHHATINALRENNRVFVRTCPIQPGAKNKNDLIIHIDTPRIIYARKLLVQYLEYWSSGLIIGLSSEGEMKVVAVRRVSEGMYILVDSTIQDNDDRVNIDEPCDINTITSKIMPTNQVGIRVVGFSHVKECRQVISNLDNIELSAD